MQATFEHAREKGEVLSTLKRLRDSVGERSHTTGEEANLEKAILAVLGTRIAGDFEYSQLLKGGF